MSPYRLAAVSARMNHETDGLVILSIIHGNGAGMLIEASHSSGSSGKSLFARASSPLRIAIVMGKDTFHGPLEQIDACCYRIPKSYKQGMRVDGLIFANEKLMHQLKLDQAPEQVANVAFLPGIQVASLAMPDIHWGYGFCIGGVCATDPDEGGVISPGGVGYDINCGVRLMRTNLYYRDVKYHLQELVDSLFKQRSHRRRQVGPLFISRQGAGSSAGARARSISSARAWRRQGDIDYTEAHGRLDGADPDMVTDHAKQRGMEQCGTLGSGNHFLEVQVVDAVFDEDAAQVMGLEKDQVCVMIHSGSRGLGYQVCDDALGLAAQVAGKVRHRSARPPARPAPRSTVRKGKSTSRPCGRPRTSPGAIASCSCSRPAKCSPRCSADRGRKCR